MTGSSQNIKHSFPLTQITFPPLRVLLKLWVVQEPVTTVISFSQSKHEMLDVVLSRGLSRKVSCLHTLRDVGP